MTLHFKRAAMTFVNLIVFVVLFSCNKSNPSDPAATPVQSEKNKTTVNRELLIKEVNRLKTIFATNDKDKIAGIFKFPISDSIQIYTDNDAYYKELKQNGNKISKGMFLKYFEEISNDIEIEQLNELFSHINTAGLLKQDKLKYENLIATEPCYNFYEIEIKNDMVTLSVGSGSNENYKSEASRDEVAENSSEICETVLWWIFRLKNEKLELITINGAG